MSINQFSFIIFSHLPFKEFVHTQQHVSTCQWGLLGWNPFEWNSEMCLNILSPLHFSVSLSLRWQGTVVQETIRCSYFVCSVLFFLSKATTDKSSDFYWCYWRLLWCLETLTWKHVSLCSYCAQRAAGAAVSPSPVQKHSQAVSLSVASRSQNREETQSTPSPDCKWIVDAHGHQIIAGFQLTAGSPLNDGCRCIFW